MKMRIGVLLFLLFGFVASDTFFLKGRVFCPIQKYPEFGKYTVVFYYTAGALIKDTMSCYGRDDFGEHKQTFIGADGSLEFKCTNEEGCCLSHSMPWLTFYHTCTPDGSPTSTSVNIKRGGLIVFNVTLSDSYIPDIGA